VHQDNLRVDASEEPPAQDEGRHREAERDQNKVLNGHLAHFSIGIHRKSGELCKKHKKWRVPLAAAP
jgi:hypothetical protein